ncbi:MAG: hypothetical protein QXG98_03410 [Candidatus Micrarchaeia archaeon]
MKMALPLLAVLLAACVLPQQVEEKPISQNEFKRIVLGEENFTIFMNTTGASREGELRIYQCGADLAGSLGLLGKNVTPYVVNGQVCVTSAGNLSLAACLRSASPTYAFFIASGSSPPLYFARRAFIFVPDNYTGVCRIAVRRNA